MNETPVLAVIGGTGLYEFEDITNIETLEISTPYGDPSSPIIIGRLKGKKVAFLARHGIGHTFSPSDVPYRANIYALKSLGIKRVVSVSACGSLREAYAPAISSFPTRYSISLISGIAASLARGWWRISAWRTHSANPYRISWKRPSKPTMPPTIGAAPISLLRAPLFNEGRITPLSPMGPGHHRHDRLPEVFLAREAEMCYTTMAHVTDYDVWHANEAPVTVEMLIKTLTKNVKVAQDTIRTMVDLIDPESSCECENA